MDDDLQSNIARCFQQKWINRFCCVSLLLPSSVITNFNSMITYYVWTIGLILSAWNKIVVVIKTFCLAFVCEPNIFSQKPFCSNHFAYNLIESPFNYRCMMHHHCECIHKIPQDIVFIVVTARCCHFPFAYSPFDFDFDAYPLIKFFT